MVTAPAPTVTTIGGTGGSAASANLASAVRAAGSTLPTATEDAELELPTRTPDATSTPIPTATPTATPTDTPTATPIPPTPAPVPTYEIRRGDTLIVIAQRHDVAVDDLMRLNGIAPNDAFSIQPGDILLIPVGDDVPYPTPTETSTPTPTPLATTTRAPTPAPPATPTEAPAQAAIRLDAPTLLSPESGTPVSCAAPSTLVWKAVPYIRTDDRYVMHLGFVSGRTADNQEIVTWVLAQPRPSSNTSWDMDGNLCGLAPHEFGRQWRWWVEVVAFEGGDWAPVSPPSATWSLSWN
jgi:LysM repeat protein